MKFQEIPVIFCLMFITSFLFFYALCCTSSRLHAASAAVSVSAQTRTKKKNAVAAPSFLRYRADSAQAQYPEPPCCARPLACNHFRRELYLSLLLCRRPNAEAEAGLQKQRQRKYAKTKTDAKTQHEICHKIQGVTLAFFNASFSWVPRNGSSA